jgi:hypothetical protein
VTVRLVALAEPYLSYAQARDPCGSLFFCSEPGPPPSRPPEVQVLPAELFLSLPDESRSYPLALAYGPALLMDACFDAGCVDYLREPWPLEELEARLRRIDRPSFLLASARFELQGPVLATEGASIGLSEAEHRLLRMLALNPGRLVPREALWEALGTRSGSSSSSLDVHLARLRKMLESLLPGSGKAIRACRGRGYRFDIAACG